MSLADARAADEAFAKMHEQRGMAGLGPFMTLPPAEKPNVTRARMARFLSDHVAGHGSVTRDDIVAAGFSGDEIESHFTEAKRIARLAQMGT
jgi:hypothetical protein